MSAGMAQPGAIAQVAADRRGHVAHFYGHEDELADSLGSCLGVALGAGAGVVMIATAGHRAAGERRMAEAGADLAAATASGAYVTLDAASLMQRFLAGDRGGPGGFDQLIEDALRRATAAGRRAVVYGEIVALLWAAGLLSAAIELESRWNELGRSYSFSLVCGYPAQRGAGAALDEVRRLHSSVIGSPSVGPRAVRGFLMAPGAPRAARHFVAGTLRQWGGRWGGGTLAADAAIVATELAANAVVHARSDFTVTVSRRLGAVRIAVRDDLRLAAPLRAAPGHGLDLVNTVATRWGVQSPAAGGKLVWAELAAPLGGSEPLSAR
jgi:MEDS: MEthanogen/methylotroph, DcmR Sensory domain